MNEHLRKLVLLDRLCTLVVRAGAAKSFAEKLVLECAVETAEIAKELRDLGFDVEEQVTQAFGAISDQEQHRKLEPTISAAFAEYVRGLEGRSPWDAPPKRMIEIWSEGHVVTGSSGGATLHGIIEARTLKEACMTLAETDSDFKFNFNPERMTWWSCKLFDNEADARKSLGVP